ncbi:ABC transporter substrate-binding protein [Hyphomicrobium sp. MC1]|uniref:ABC transporter substrate-binding protein n=1 Tax=Hyphomicrobium sp. (strain MC1) TaxID=717785 RepID=UPI000213EB5E|nr:NrtA/SsuA/CpmA family ABC transporter substrate-binding protein [Hyphomicrobium sp. MC1]CCB66601.1 ABC-type nitrate/sulfonate/bicarbonate transport systems, periplasmic components [Hyphomicrobium sp. MC1]
MSRYRAVWMLAAAFLGTIFAHSPLMAEDARIRIGYPSGMNGQVPVVLDKAGIAAKHHLAAEFTGFQYGPPMMEGLATGQLDAVVTSFLPPFTLASKIPGSVKFVATLGHSTHSLLVRKDSTAKKLEDLKGQKIGVSFNSESHLDLLVSLKEKGLDPKTDVQLVNLQPNELPAALEKGLVAAALVRQPQVLRLEESVGAKPIQTWPFRFTSVVSENFLKKNPQAVADYVAALKEAVLFTANHSDQASTWFAETQRIDPSVVKKLAGENPLYSAKSLDDVRIEVDDDFKKLISERLAAATENGFVKSKIDPASLVP